MKFNIGDEAFLAHVRWQEKWITCPDCCGQKYLTIIYGDGTQATINCAGCGPGYEPPCGVVKLTEKVAKVTPVTINRVELSQDGKVSYGCTPHYSSTDIFATEEEAKTRADELALEENAKELERINNKHNRSHTWSWNAHYHRREIKEAEKRLAYHRAKLDVAKVKAKEG